MTDGHAATAVLGTSRDVKRPEGGAGGNRTPVRQAVTVRATTIPEFEADAASPPGRLTSEAVHGSVFPGRQRSFPPSAVFPAVILRFCCRAAVDRPRAALRVTMSLMSPSRSGGESELLLLAVLLLPRLTSLSNSGRTLGSRSLTSKPISPWKVYVGRACYRVGLHRAFAMAGQLSGRVPGRIALGDGLSSVTVRGPWRARARPWPDRRGSRCESGTSVSRSCATRARSRSSSPRCNSSLRLRSGSIAPKPWAKAYGAMWTPSSQHSRSSKWA